MPRSAPVTPFPWSAAPATLLFFPDQRGISHKIAAAKGKGQLVFFGHSSVGGWLRCSSAAVVPLHSSAASASASDDYHSDTSCPCLTLPPGMLNSVIELWRFDSAQACKEAREASRADPEWRATVAAVSTGVQHFSSAFLHATTFSPMQ